MEKLILKNEMNVLKPVDVIRMIVFLIFSLSIPGITKSQTPTLIASQSFQASGAGTAGVPTVMYNIPAGKSRMMVVTVAVERNHGATPNSNWPANTDGTLATATTRVFVNIGGIATKNLGNGQSAAYRFEAGNDARVWLSTQYNVQYLTDDDGLPVGLTGISFPNLTVPENAGDEMIVTIAVFENAHATPQQVFTNIDNSFSNTGYTLTAGSAGTPTTGTTTTNIMYLSNALLSQQGNALTISSGWNTLQNLQVANTGGSSLPGSGYGNEQDGIRLASVTRSGIATAPGVTFTRSGTTNILSASGGIYAILPLARPAVSGTVYRDNNGNATIDGGGTGGGVWNIANTLWVNAVQNGVVIATAPVNTSGVFSFAAGGALVEGNNVSFQLSNTQGTVNSAPPGTNLPSGWTTVGESTTGGPSDGTPNGEFTLTIGDASSANNVTNRFGVRSNNPPVAVNDSYTMQEDGSPITLTPLVNDSDPDGNPLTITSINGVPRTPGTAQSIPVPNGTVNITAAGVITFTPNANYNGVVTFPYVISDGNGGTATANEIITVTPVNDPPVAVDDTYVIEEGETITLFPLTADSDPDGNTLTVTSINGVTLTPGTAQTIAVPNGTLNITAAGVISFTANANYTGTVSFPYTISDGNGGTATANEIIVVLQGGPLPVKITYFSASKAGKKALLNWSTSIEQNNKGFAIEHSADGISWNDIGFVNSKAVNGNSSTVLNYSIEYNALLNAVNYYRLKQVDLDGSLEYSDVRMLNFDAAATIRIYPNPAVEWAIIDGLNGKEIITIYSADGKLVKKENVNSSVYKVNVTLFASGIYNLIVTDASGKVIAQHRLVKGRS